MHKLRMKLDPAGTGDIYLDGERLRGVRGLSFTATPGELTTVTIKLIADVDIEADLEPEAVTLDIEELR